jgi:hypothetical protein
MPCSLVGREQGLVSTLSMEAAASLDTLISIHQGTRHRIPEDKFLHLLRHENLKSHKFFTLCAAEERKQSRGVVLQFFLTKGF